MAMIDLEQHGDVVLVRWADGENRFNRDSVARWHELLDDLESRDGPLAVVLTGQGKFFSNGLDLDAFATDPDAAGPILEGVHRLFGRMLLFPAFTVAALNGHAFAGGAMLACAFDQRVMRGDRGYWCLPEVDLGLPVTPGMLAVITSRLSTAAAADALVTGRRYGADEALALGIVEHTAAEADVVGRAVELASEMAGKNRAVIADHKRQLFASAAAVCGWPVP
jgi:enoyl-CoA hydratase/carnithine racemase